MRYIITILYVFLITPRIQAQSVHFDNRMTEFLITTLLEKIYIQTDKPYYVVEDTIWMKAYVVNAQIHQPSPSNFVYIELINRLDSVEKRIKIRKENHAFCGYITLDKKLIPGEYVLRAYTNWMRNESPDYFFQKTITIGRIMQTPKILTVTYYPDEEGKLRTIAKYTYNDGSPVKKLTICREGDHFVCHVKIDNRQAILQSLYVKASPNNPLNVEYVELQGITTDTGVPVTEKVSK